MMEKPLKHPYYYHLLEEDKKKAKVKLENRERLESYRNQHNLKK